jgi:hypothetical protein
MQPTFYRRLVEAIQGSSSFLGHLKAFTFFAQPMLAMHRPLASDVFTLHSPNTVLVGRAENNSNRDFVVLAHMLELVP